MISTGYIINVYLFITSTSTKADVNPNNNNLNNKINSSFFLLNIQLNKLPNTINAKYNDTMLEHIK